MRRSPFHRFLNLNSFVVLATRWGLPLLVMLTGLCFAAATWERFSISPGGAESAIQALVATVNSDSGTSSGWSARMHFFFNLALGWAGARIYMASVGLKWDTFAARWLARSHVIVLAGRSESEAGVASKRAGAGYMADGDRRSFAIEVALSMAPTRDVTLCIPQIDDGSRMRLWQSGVRLLVADLAIPELLQAANSRRARMVVAMRDSFEENIALARCAFDADHDDALEARLLVEAQSVVHRFAAEHYFDRATLPRIRCFSEADLLARRLLLQFPPDAATATDDRARVHVLLVGFGAVGQSLAVQLARVGHYRSGLKPRLTVVDRNASSRFPRLVANFPAIEDWIEIDLVDRHIEDLWPNGNGQQDSPDIPFSAAYVCTRDEIANIRIANLILASRTVEQHACPVVALDPPGGCLLENFRDQKVAENRDFHLLSLFDGRRGAEKSEDVLADISDQLARRLHAAYCAKDDTARQSDPLRPRARFNKPWEELPETGREANRRVIDHLDVKLRAVGRRLLPQGTAMPQPLTAEEIELLARMEHNRWWADRALDGWTYGPVRDDARKRHPQMVRYEELDESARQLDRDSVRETISALEDRGMTVACAPGPCA